MSVPITLREADMFGDRINITDTRLVVNIAFAEPATLHYGGEDTDADTSPLHSGGEDTDATTADVHISGL